MRVNGHDYSFEAPVGRTLADVLRDEIGLTGTKVACGEGHCGACTVQLDGVPTLSCITLVHTVGDREVTTIEGLREHPLIDAFVRADALQCGFCTPGQIVSAAALVAEIPKPSSDEIKHRMAGNLCRCGTYPRIEEAIRQGSLLAASRRYERGDYERGLADADAVVEGAYTTQTLNHNPLETHQCVCEWRGDGLDVYVSTQYIWGLRDELARALELPPDRVRVVCEFMGGGFGAKNGIGDYLLLAAELARRTGRPVRAAVTRRDENVVGGNRNASRQHVTAGARSDGTLTVLGGEYTCALGAGGWLAPTAGPTQLLYACENVRTVEHA